MLKEGGNVLLLDEPTNDLDVETLRALEEALENFAGCAVVISHDRFFLDRLATHILAFEGDSHVEWFEGNFEAYEEDKVRRSRRGSDAAASDDVSENDEMIVTPGLTRGPLLVRYAPWNASCVYLLASGFHGTLYTWRDFGFELLIAKVRSRLKAGMTV